MAADLQYNDEEDIYYSDSDDYNEIDVSLESDAKYEEMRANRINDLDQSNHHLVTQSTKQCDANHNQTNGIDNCCDAMLAIDHQIWKTIEQELHEKSERLSPKIRAIKRCFDLSVDQIETNHSLSLSDWYSKLNRYFQEYLVEMDEFSVDYSDGSDDCFTALTELRDALIGLSSHSIDDNDGYDCVHKICDQFSQTDISGHILTQNYYCE